MISRFLNFGQSEQRFLAPEVIQTSAMDCGPAALKCLLEGFGISASYGRLREACQTDVDGTSINMIEQVAKRLGLEAKQVMVPADHLLLPVSDTLPALVVVRLPDGLNHFVIAWRLHGRLIQVMDPATGRRFVRDEEFLRQVYVHEYPVSREAWRAWAGGEGFCGPLRQRMLNLKLDTDLVERLIEGARQDPDWRPLATLDATTRLVEGIVRADGLKADEQARVFSHFLKRASDAVASDSNQNFIPDSYWSVLPLSPTANAPEDYLLLRGAVLIRVFGRKKQEPAADVQKDDEAAVPLSLELKKALEEGDSKPLLELWKLLREDGLLAPSLLVVALGFAVFGVMIEALLLRGLLDIGFGLELLQERTLGVGLLFIYLIALFLIEFPIASTALRLGRHLESRLRTKFLLKIPRLGARYFHSRLTSDMVQRAHELRQIRLLPNLAVLWVRLIFELLLTTIGVIWINPNSAGIAILATISAVAFSIVSQPFLVEQELSLRTHVAALSRFYLDALLGLIPIRTHSAEGPIRRQHEGLLVEWIQSSMRFYRMDIILTLASNVVSSGFAVWIVFDYIAKGGEPSGILLLFYWTLRLPALGTALAQAAQQYPMYRNRVLRLLEPLGASEETEIFSHEPADVPEKPFSPFHRDREGANSPPTIQGGQEGAALSIRLENVSVQAGGHTILSQINLSIKAGEHIAIVGPSGAGKSTLVGLLLGWHRAATGTLLVDGYPIGSRLPQLRRQTAWVDPAVQLWNRSLLDNLEYGTEADEPDLITSSIKQADLYDVLERLPDGLQARLGEGGALLSGGEGQRVRLGRAMYRQEVRLVILDEAFRGLDRSKRQELLARAREHWQEATLLFVSHDVGQIQDFERVLVIEEGKIVEDDAPMSLLQKPNSRYRALLEAEEEVQQEIWGSAEWRRLWLENGRLNEKKGMSPQQ